MSLSNIVRPYIEGDPIPNCAIVRGPRSRNTSLELAQSERVILDERTTSFVEYVHAGRNVYMNVESSQAIPLRVRLSYKANHPFVPVCEGLLKEYGSGSPDKLILGTFQESRVSDTIWRVELSAPSAGVNTTPTSLTVRTWRDHDPEAIDTGPRTNVRVPGQGSPGDATPSMSGREYLCYPNSMAGGSPLEHTSNPFASRPVLNVTVKDPSGLLKADHRKAVDEIIVHAVTLWNRACKDCPAGNALLVVVGKRLYLNGRLADNLRNWSALEEAHQAPTFDQLLAMSNARIDSYALADWHEPVEENDPAILHLCAFAPTELPTRSERYL